MSSPASNNAKNGRETLWNAVRAVIVSQRQGPPLEPVPGDAPLPASFGQQRIWFLERLIPGSPLYNLTVAFKMAGKLSADCLKQSLSEMLRRHEALRTTLQLMDGHLVQKINPPPDQTMTLVDLRNLEPAQSEGEARRQAEAEARKPFDFESGALMRACLFRLADDEHLLVLTVHHLAFDGWSFDPFMREFCAIYSAFIEGKPSPLPELQLQYADFAVWQRRRLDEKTLGPLLDYWKQQMKGPLPELLIPSDRPRNRHQTYRGETLDFSIPQDLTEAIKRLSADEGVTPFMTLLAAFQALLHRYTGEDDVIVGSPVANRNRIETENMIGLFANTLALRVRLEPQLSFRELLARVRHVVLDAYIHQDLPFEMLVDALGLQRQTNSSPLFKVMFAYQNVPGSAWSFPGLNVNAYNVANGMAKFDVTTVMWDTTDGFGGLLEYDAELFAADFILQLLGHFQTLLENFVRNPGQSIAAVPMLSGAERHWLLHKWNETAIEYPRSMTIHQVFEAQVRRVPEATALVSGRNELTYAELDGRANRLARYLMRSKAGPDNLVGVCLDPSPALIVALLAILKAGAAYVPIDPSSPEEYVVRTLKGARLALVLTETAMASRLSGLAKKIALLDGDGDEIAGESDAPLEARGRSESLAYVMYTSGSTGKPKGVCITHRGVVRLVKEANYASLTSEDGFLHLAPIFFDASTFEIWGALLNGARLVLPPARRLSLAEICQTICRHRVSVLFLTPVLFELLVDTHLADLVKVRQLLVGGDILSVPHAERFLSQAKGCRLINCYGPTENSAFTTFHRVERGGLVAGESIPIGRPISNTQIYVLDSLLQPLPIGVPGEIYIGGDGLMLGYLDATELTNERLVANPFADLPGTFLYKTGDLARYRRDGNIEFLGRIDDQVKIRGFRVEPAEVEAVLGRCPLVKNAAVAAREFRPDGKRLVAYVVPELEESSPGGLIAAMHTFMREQVPDYLVPSEFVLLDTLPMNNSGKVDRRSLPSPIATALPGTECFASPRDEVERLVSLAFQEALGTQAVGLNDSFFNLGGNSMQALRLFEILGHRFKTSLPLVSLFEHPTVAGLAAFLRSPAESSPDLGSTIVEIKSGRSERPFFLVPGGRGGMAEMTLYAGLMSHLDRDQPVYGLLALQISGETSRASVSERAAAYIQEIRRLQPRGPYLLGGECLGGVVAFEMAQQLLAQGQEVALLLLMDTWCPIDARPFRGRYFDLPRAILRSRISIARAGLSNLRRMLQRHTRIQPQFSPAREPSDWAGLALTMKHKAASWLCTLRNNEETMRYQPKPYPGRITLLISSYNFQKGLPQNWQRLSRGGLVVHTVPGNHDSYIRDTPEATALQLRTCLDEAAGHE